GASVTVLPSGYLPAWALLQTMNAWLSHPEQDGAFPAANRLVNRSVGLASGCEPAYRHVLVVDRAGRDHSARLSDLVAPHGPDLAAVQAALAALAGAAVIAAEAGDAIPSAGEDLAPEVSFVIVTCDRRELLAGCLESIAALDYPGDRVEIVVYDNGSRDGTRDWLARARRDVRVVAGTANAGFAAPNNRAADVAAGRLLCLVNNDDRVGPDFLRELVDARAATGAACVGARALSADGTAIEFDGGTMSFYGHAAPHRHGERADEPAADAPPVPTLF